MTLKQHAQNCMSWFAFMVFQEVILANCNLWFAIETSVISRRRVTVIATNKYESIACAGILRRSLNKNVTSPKIVVGFVSKPN